MSNNRISTARTMCCGRVKAGTAGWRTAYKACSRIATVERNGKPYCGQHDPDAVASRRQARNAAWDTKHERERADDRLRHAAPDLLAALKGLLLVADQKTAEFDAACAAITKAEGIGETRGGK
jgi:hypothetical protein